MTTARRSSGSRRLPPGGALALLAAASAFAPAQAAPRDSTPVRGAYGFESADDGDPAVATEDDAPGAPVRDADVPPLHTVERGDTLWGISETYFKDPWRWPKLWASNPDISNPHWIFPGQVIRLRDDAGRAAPAVAAAAPDTRRAPAGAAPVGLAPPPPRAPDEAHQLRQIGFVEEETLKAAGVINGSVEEKIMLATGDQAYVELPGGWSPARGARYTVYSVDLDRPVREPGSNRLLGYLVHVHGETVIDEIPAGGVATAHLIDLVSPVERGYRVGPLVRQFRSVVPRGNRAGTRARIVAAVAPSSLIAEQMFVVLDRGRRHGVEAGNRFVVLRQGDGLARLMERESDTVDTRFPPYAVAELLAVDVQNETTIGWVSRGSRELRIGDVADLPKGY